MRHWIWIDLEMHDIVYDFKPTASKPSDVIRKPLFRYDITDEVQRLPSYQSSKSFEDYTGRSILKLVDMNAARLGTLRASCLHNTLGLNGDARIALLRARRPFRPRQHHLR